MPANHGQTLLSSLLILAALRSVAPAADWPQWGGDNHRNMVSAEKGLPTEFVPGNRSAGTIDPATTRNVRWVARLGSHTYGTPVVAGGRVFVGTNDFGLSDPRLKTARGGLLKCLDAATGKTLWQLIIPRKEVDPKEFAFDHMHLGLCSSATVDGERLYVVSNRCEVLCLDVDGMADGNDGPFVDEGRYIVAKGEPRKGDGADLPERPEGCFAQISPVPFSPHDGDIVWRFDMWEDPRVATRPTDAANCCVLADGDFLYVCTSNGVDQWPSDTSPLVVPAPLAPSLIVLEKHTGRLVAMDEEKIGTRLLHGQWSSPSLGVVGGRKLVFFGAGDGRCYAFEAVSEVRQEPYALEKVWSCDCIPLEYRVYEDGKLLDYRCGDRRNPMSRNRNDGRFVGLSEIVATPVFHRDRVYVAIGRDPHHGAAAGCSPVSTLPSQATSPARARSGPTTRSSGACRPARSPTGCSGWPTWPERSTASTPTQAGRNGSTRPGKKPGPPPWLPTARCTSAPSATFGSSPPAESSASWPRSAWVCRCGVRRSRRTGPCTSPRNGISGRWGNPSQIA